jgi:hypothetical protein
VPTRYRRQSYRPAPTWLSIWRLMYSELEPRAVSILQSAGFYEAHDLEVPVEAEGRKLTQDEKAAIESIATALTIAADCAHRTEAGVVAAWLRNIAKSPALFRSKCLPPEVHWAIVSNYRRGLERPGTHLQDVWGRRRVRFEGKARRPTKPNIARAALAAAESLERVRGRPRNQGNRVLAEELSRAFRFLGGRIVRRQVPVDRAGGGVRFVEDGPFNNFLDQVIGPLQAHLKRYGLSAVTIETIERIATREFTLAK